MWSLAGIKFGILQVSFCVSIARHPDHPESSFCNLSLWLACHTTLEPDHFESSFWCVPQCFGMSHSIVTRLFEFSSPLLQCHSHTGIVTVAVFSEQPLAALQLLQHGLITRMTVAVPLTLCHMINHLA